MKRYPDGLYYNKPHAKSPDFVKGKMSIHRDKLVEWLKGEEVSDKGYIFLDVLEGKEGNVYVAVNEWTAQKKKNDDDIPVMDLF